MVPLKGLRWVHHPPGRLVGVAITAAILAGAALRMRLPSKLLAPLRHLGGPQQHRISSPFPPSAAQEGRSKTSGGESPSILFVSRLPPDSDGPGGTQRTMQLLRSLARLGTVDLVLLQRSSDLESVAALSGEPVSLVRHFARLEIAEWKPAEPSRSKALWQIRQIMELFRFHAPDAPRFSNSTLRKIAAALPSRQYDFVFCGRLSSGCIVDQLIHAGALTTNHKIVDLDDVVSRFRERELAIEGPTQGRLRRSLQRIVIRRLRAAELHLCKTWDVVGLPAKDELDGLRTHMPSARLQLFPNVVDRPYLTSSSSIPNRVLFVGHLSYTPNVDGLRVFLRDAWPIIRHAVPGASLDVVGMYATSEVIDVVAAAGGRLHANVPTVEPFYESCSVVVPPLRYASGTRIKILEAMAFGRAVVSTTVGAAGLDLVAGTHALIADGMNEFAAAVIQLCQGQELRTRLASEGRQFQQTHYSRSALNEAVGTAFHIAEARGR